jgi:hypothetical protein
MHGGFRLGQIPVPQVSTPQVLGQQIENPISQLIAKYHGFGLAAKAPSATRPAIEVPATELAATGFDIVDVDPANVRGVLKFWNQLDKWRDFGWKKDPNRSMARLLFLYDNQGNVYLYRIFDM